MCYLIFTSGILYLFKNHIELNLTAFFLALFILSIFIQIKEFDISNNSITRPEVGLPVPLKNKVLHFTDAHDLMRLVASERRLIIQL